MTQITMGFPLVFPRVLVLIHISDILFCYWIEIFYHFDKLTSPKMKIV